VQGGVARNVAECMSKLGAKPYMISALGFDMAGKILIFISKHLKFYLLAFVMIKRSFVIAYFRKESLF
jgi:bifunctional ADP-heptose synthase (sugar kinase/adenylyltransferase)